MILYAPRGKYDGLFMHAVLFPTFQLSAITKIKVIFWLDLNEQVLGK